MGYFSERATRFELVTSSLGSWHSTTELRPQVLMQQGITSICRLLDSLSVTLIAAEPAAPPDSTGWHPTFQDGSGGMNWQFAMIIEGLR